ncbi:hypothetical protein GCM10009422_22990 [Brevundimonas kwangchunensis]|uniref:Uncharacterized protein n=1 Tax=Brevundimonas kwangchunensis TaxID=322163 RepID=A0ABN1H0T1_9CAUL
MQALVELITGLVAMLAAAALSLFGVDMNAPEKPRAEIHRVRDCGDGASNAVFTASAERKSNC